MAHLDVIFSNIWHILGGQRENQEIRNKWRVSSIFYGYLLACLENIMVRRKHVL